MSIRGCLVIAVEGTQASGKTTLAHGLVSAFSEAGRVVSFVAEPARASPFVEEVVFLGRGEFDIFTEVDLLGAQLSQQLRAARHSEILICDKTILNVLAYTKELLVAADIPSSLGPVIPAMRIFAQAWSKVYDLVFMCNDEFGESGDAHRAKVMGRQADVARTLRAECQAASLNLLEIPSGLSTDRRVAFCRPHVMKQVERVCGE